MAEALAKIPNVEIDPEGTFKYILVTVKVKDGDVQKNIIRGTKSAEYHSKLKFHCCRHAALLADTNPNDRFMPTERLIFDHSLCLNRIDNVGTSILNCLVGLF